MKTILIIGATSAIAEETGRLYSSQGHRLVLWGRRQERLKSLQRNFELLGANQVFCFAIDLDDLDRHRELFTKTVKKVGSIDIVLIAHGTLPDQQKVQNSNSAISEVLTTNFLSYASLMTVVAEYFEESKRGTLAVITSVAADRGRKSNYVYGAAKAGASAFADGLRGRLAASGVFVVNIKPGMVDTPMTSHLKKGPLLASAETVARGVLKAVQKQKQTVYIPGYWRLIMFIVRHIPEVLFKKMNF